MVLTDQKGTILLVNREVERLFGYEREELVGQPVETLVPPRGSRAGPHRAQGEFFLAPETRSMGFGRELFRGAQGRP